jgi:hypothetical protein
MAASRSVRQSVQLELPVELSEPPCGQGLETPIENRFEGFTVLADTNQHDIPLNFWCKTPNKSIPRLTTLSTYLTTMTQHLRMGSGV